METVRLCHVVENGVDVRTVEGLSRYFQLTVVGMNTGSGKVVTYDPVPPVPTVQGTAGRLKYAVFVYRYLKAHASEMDAVLVQQYGGAALGANLAARATKKPTAMLLLSPVEVYYLARKAANTPDKPFRWYELAALKTVARLNALLGQRYITVSHFLADVARSHGGKKPVDVISIYGVDTDVFQPTTTPRTELKAQLGLPTSGSLLFFSSRIAPEKDTESLLKAFRSLVEKGHDLYLLNLSGGFQKIKKAAEEMNIGNRVLAADAVHPHRGLNAYYQASDLCIQASREEGLGYSPLEALACGTPAVATSVGGLRETIFDGKTGWTYPPGDWQKLSDCIVEALTDRVEAQRRTQAGRELVCAEHAAHLGFEKTYKLFAELTGHTRSVSPIL